MVIPPSEDDGIAMQSAQERSSAVPVSTSWPLPTDEPPEAMSLEAQERLARHVMRQQGGLSLQVAALFVVLLLGLPLVNLYQPGLAATRVFGFSLTWLFLGVLFYPITVLLSVYFVRQSDRIEAASAKWHDVSGEEQQEEQRKGEQRR